MKGERLCSERMTLKVCSISMISVHLFIVQESSIIIRNIAWKEIHLVSKLFVIINTDILACKAERTQMKGVV